MSLVVCKFGGTSVASPERIKMVANKLIAKKKAGDDVVAVVSAMGKTTDELVGLANALNTNPPARELDRLLSTGEQVSMTLLAMALEAQGYRAMSFTAARRASARTGRTTRRRSSACDPTASWRRSTKGIIPVIAGFQGIDDNDDMTTLGRGGSDTTAVAVAWGINADVCEIYSDVEGVFTADPRVCPRAKKLDQISYDDMLELAGAGAGVLQMRAVEFARKWNVVIHSRSAFSDAEGHVYQGGSRHGGSGNHRHCARHVRGQGHDSRRSRYVGRGGEAVQRAGIQPGERRHDHSERVGVGHH